MTRDELRERLAVAISGTTCTTGRSYRTIDAVLSALREEGLAVVPAEADEAMLRRAGDAFVDAVVGHMPGDVASVNTPFKRWYRAMLAAGDLLGGKDG